MKCIIDLTKGKNTSLSFAAVSTAVFQTLYIVMFNGVSVLIDFSGDFLCFDKKSEWFSGS